MIKRLTPEEIRLRLQEVTDTELLSSEYKNNHTDLLFRCSCGKTFSRTWNNLWDGKRFKCFDCATESEYEIKRLSVDDLSERLQKFGCSLVSEKVKNQKSKIKILCKCGHEREITVNSLCNTSFTGLCVNCSRAGTSDRQKNSIDDMRNASRGYGVELLTTEYKGARAPIEFRCSCGRVFKTSWNNFLSGKHTCNWCAKRRSRGEKRISEWLAINGIQFEEQKKFPGLAGLKPYRFDFYIPSENLCIEYDGVIHYAESRFPNARGTPESILERDRIKNKYCEENGIKLIRIPYYSYKNIESILGNMLIPR